VTDLATAFDQLQALENELSLAQRWVYGRITEILDRLNDHLGVDADSRFHAEVLAAVATESKTTAEIVEAVDAPADAIRGALNTLADRGLVSQQGDEWQVT
jgi:ArsR family transcriptional regulator